MIEFTEVTDDGEEIEHELPSKFEVCSECEGHGTHLAPSIGEHAYSAEEFNESFDEEERSEYFRRGGRYDVQCSHCEGKRVEEVVDESKCDKELLKKYRAQQDEDFAYERMCESERRYGA